jgi:hypothetical protein
LVDRPHQSFDIGPELCELGFVLLAEFLEPYDLFAEPGLEVALGEGIAGCAGLDGEGHGGQGSDGALGPDGQMLVRAAAGS